MTRRKIRVGVKPRKSRRLKIKVGSKIPKITRKKRKGTKVTVPKGVKRRNLV